MVPLMSSSRRVVLLDLLRGAVIVWMALDHTRDFFQPVGTSPEDLSTTTVALFATRWVTHLCAPSFVFLAGVGMGLQVQRKGLSRSLMTFFATRGLWLMFLECTWVTFSWFFSFRGIHLGVLWGIGGAMILAAPFTALSSRWQALIGGAVLLALNLGDPVSLGGADFLIRPLNTELWGVPIYSIYAIIPWWTVMMLGMAAARLFAADDTRRLLRGLGLALVAGFVVVRALQWGDPSPWALQERGAAFTVLSFLQVSKYPPSLAYLLATLGMAFTMGSFLPSLPAGIRHVLRIFGRVPLFYYLIHLPLLHLAGTVFAQAVYGRPAIPGAAALSLPLIYGVWITVTFLLYWPCRAYEHRKATQRAPWMRYL